MCTRKAKKKDRLKYESMSNIVQNARVVITEY